MPPAVSESADGSVMVVSLAIRKNVSIAGTNVVDSEFSRYASNANARFSLTLRRSPNGSAVCDRETKAGTNKNKTDSDGPCFLYDGQHKKDKDYNRRLYSGGRVAAKPIAPLIASRRCEHRTNVGVCTRTDAVELEIPPATSLAACRRGRIRSESPGTLAVIGPSKHGALLVIRAEIVGTVDRHDFGKA
jgi:hypothetical protein